MTIFCRTLWNRYCVATLRKILPHLEHTSCFGSGENSSPHHTRELQQILASHKVRTFNDKKNGLGVHLLPVGRTERILSLLFDFAGLWLSNKYSVYHSWSCGWSCSCNWSASQSRWKCRICTSRLCSSIPKQHFISLGVCGIFDKASLNFSVVCTSSREKLNSARESRSTAPIICFHFLKTVNKKLWFSFFLSCNTIITSRQAQVFQETALMSSVKIKRSKFGPFKR